MVKRKRKKKNMANYIKCSITGELCYISQDRKKKLAEKHGGLSILKANYISRDANFLLKNHFGIKEIQRLGKEERKEVIAAVKEKNEKRKAERKARIKKRKVLEVNEQGEYVLPEWMKRKKNRYVSEEHFIPLSKKQYKDVTKLFKTSKSVSMERTDNSIVLFGNK